MLATALAKVGIPEEQCFYTNVCTCRPPENRKPTAEEIGCCWPRLEEELKDIKPDFVVALGATAGRTLFSDYKNMGSSRGRILATRVGGTGLLTYHPAAILYPRGEQFLPFLVRDLNKALRALQGNLATQDFPTEVKVITNPGEVQRVVDEILILSDIEPFLPVAYDWETTGTSTRRAIGFCLGLSWRPGQAVVIPVAQVRECLPYLTHLFRAPKLRFVAYNAMFDLKFNELIGLPGRVDADPMLMHYCLDEQPQQRSLENMSMLYFDAPPYESDMLEHYDCAKNEMIKVIPPEVIYDYCGRDCDYALRLFLKFEEELKKRPKLEKVHWLLLIPGVKAFADIERYGVWVDRERLQAVAEEYEKELAATLAESQELVGDPEFNPNSHPQVREALWDHLGLEEPDIYKRKPRSADKGTRAALLKKYPKQEFVRCLDRYKELYTVLSRYLRVLPKYIEDDGRVRPSYHFDRTETGRLSTTRPAIHQVPRGHIRTILAAPPGRMLIQADYEQVEIRTAAHYAQDEKLIELLGSGTDFHALMASEAFRIPIDRVTPEQRQAAKSVSFGLLYLMGDRMLADQTGLPSGEATEFVRRYKSLMPAVWQWIEKIKRQVKDQKYVESLFGRRRRFPLITRANLADIQREAVNMPIQSAASDLCLWQVIKLHTLFKQRYPEVHIIAMSHDSIVVECPEGLAPIVAAIMAEEMPQPPFQTDVLFPVKIKIGQRWGEGDVWSTL